MTKASVTIVFDNSDPAKSPDGFQQHRQITVTRQISMPNNTKYLLNGHKAQQQQILNLFQSVQLNINNPNFVIMQGRITKVLNMRPQEILGMVEEAAGTRMFEDRKEKALKTIKKKEKRVQEITTDLENEIKPKLEKLRSEKRKFIEYQKAIKELEHIGRKIKAWDWTLAQERVEKKGEEIEAKEREIKELESEKKSALKEIKASEKAMETVQAQRTAEISKGGKLKKLQEKVDTLEKDVVKYKTQAEIKEDSVAQEEAKGKALVQELEDVSGSVFLSALLLTQRSSKPPSARRSRTSANSTSPSKKSAMPTPGSKRKPSPTKSSYKPSSPASVVPTTPGEATWASSLKPRRACSRPQRKRRRLTSSLGSQRAS